MAARRVLSNALWTLFHTAFVAAQLAVTAACSDPNASPQPQSDAGATDAGATDAGATDAGAADAGATDAGPGDAGRSDAGRTDAGVMAGATLELPRVPQTRVTLNATPNFPAPGDRSMLLAESPILFALAEGYPRELTGVFAGSYYAGFGPLDGDLSFSRLEVPAGAAAFMSATLLDTGVRIAVSQEGEAELVAYGIYTPTEQERVTEALMGLSSVPFELHIPVAAKRVVGTRFALPAGCTEPGYVATSSMLEFFSVALVDPDGAQFSPSNATIARPVAMSIETETPHVWAELREGQGLDSLRFPSFATRVTVRPEFGEPLEFDVLDASAITQANVTFALAGYAGGSLELSDGMTYEGGWNRSSNRIAPIVTDLRAGERALCSRADPAWFDLVSDTPEQCDVRPLTSVSLDSLVLPRADVGLSAFVRADGVCSLRLRAARFAGGAGLERRVAVTLRNVDAMHQVP